MSTFSEDNDDGTNCVKLRLVQSETGEEVGIPRLQPGEAYRTLGAWVAADGSQDKQLEILAAKVTVWVNNITRSSLSSQDKQIMHSAFLKLQILYPIGCASIKHKDLKKLFCPVLDVILHTGP